jgi:uncharacterized protein YunC (DUF1805 family)
MLPGVKTASQLGWALRRDDHWVLSCWLGLCFLALSAFGNEGVIPSIKVGNQTFSNLTVQSRNTNFLFIVHEGGLATLKVKDLSAEARELLGLAPLPVQTNRSTLDAVQQKLAAVPQLQLRPETEQKLRQLNSDQVLNALQLALKQNLGLILGLLAGLLTGYLFCSYCCLLICQKAGYDPKGWIWVPLAQFYPLLRAAGLPGWTFCLLFLPLAGVVVWVLWCFKICQACGKGPLVAVLLLLPVTNLLAFLYLAFADTGASRNAPDAPDSLATKLKFS